MIKKHAARLMLIALSMPFAAAAQTDASVPTATLAPPPAPLSHWVTQAEQRCAANNPSFAPGERDRLVRWYHSQNEQALWGNPPNLNALTEQLEQLADDGLDPSQYHLSELRQPTLADSDQAHCQEIIASQMYFRALQHLSEGRFDQNKLDNLWRPAEIEKPQSRVLPLAQKHHANVAEAFNEARPNTPQYHALRSVYAKKRNEPTPRWPLIANGPSLREGQSDSRVTVLRERLQLEGYLSSDQDDNANSTRYDATLVRAVKDFQRTHALQDDGVIGPATLASLNTNAQDRLAQLRINLERLRWMNYEMTPRMLVVDVNGGYILNYDDGELTWKTRGQVGTPRRQTPLLRSTINRITLNPTWTIPPTILREDKLPKIRQDLSYLQRSQLTVLDRNGNRLNPYDVDWSRPGSFMLRQAAGPRNPLGKVAIRFPNPFSVYLHDTPSQDLFSRTQRATSSGCVRVEGALDLVDLLLQPEERARVQQRIASGKTSEYRLDQPVPLLIAYWTVEVTPEGEIQYRPDIYNRDNALIRAMERQ